MPQEYQERHREKAQLKKFLYVVLNVGLIDLNDYIEENFKQVDNHYIFIV